MRTGTYRVGAPTHARWAKDVAAANQVIADNDALVTDPADGWVGVDPAKLPAGFGDYYAGLRQVGYWHGWLTA